MAIAFTGIAGTIAYQFHGSIDWTASLLLAATAIVTAYIGARFANELPEWKLKKSFGAFQILIAVLMLANPYLHQFTTGAPGASFKIVVLLTTGVFTGFLSGMMGVGGGAIMVPAMVLLLGFNQYTAQGSSLLAMIPGSSVGAFTHWRLGNVKTQLLPGLIAGVIVGTYVGGSIANMLPERELQLMFCALLVWSGIRYVRTRIPPA